MHTSPPFTAHAQYEKESLAMKRYMTQYEFWGKQHDLDMQLRRQLQKERNDQLRPFGLAVFAIIAILVIIGVVFPQ